MANKEPCKGKVMIGDSVVEVEAQEKGIVAIVQALSDVVRGGRIDPESRAVTPVAESLSLSA